MVEVAEER